MSQLKLRHYHFETLLFIEGGRAQAHVQAAMPNTAIELSGVADIAFLTGISITKIRLAPPELEQKGVDVLFNLDGRPVGVQHTILHPDEGHIPGKRGSPARAKEETMARTTQLPFMVNAKFDFRPALRLRIDEKIAIAARHRGVVPETWLVISANLFKWGAVGSTTIAAAALRPDGLNTLCHAALDASAFECVCLVLHMDRIVWGWDRRGRWRVLADPYAQEREEHRSEMARLVFDLIPADFQRRMKRS